MEAMQEGVVAGYPVKDVRVRVVRRLLPHGRLLRDGVQARGLAGHEGGSLSGRPGAARADHDYDLAVPEDSVGDVIGASTRAAGARWAWNLSGAGMTEIKAEVPMAELLSYAPDLRAITGGQGEFTMEFLRYEEVPGAPGGQGRRRVPRREGGRQGVGPRVQRRARSRSPKPGSCAWRGFL